MDKKNFLSFHQTIQVKLDFSLQPENIIFQTIMTPLILQKALFPSQYENLLRILIIRGVEIKIMNNYRPNQDTGKITKSSNFISHKTLYP